MLPIPILVVHILSAVSVRLDFGDICHLLVILLFDVSGRILCLLHSCGRPGAPRGSLGCLVRLVWHFDTLTIETTVTLDFWLMILV